MTDSGEAREQQNPGSTPEPGAPTSLDKALQRIAHDVHLVLSDHYSGLKDEREAAMPAYARLTVIFEREDESGDAVVRDTTDEIIEAALDPVRFGLHPKAALDNGAETPSGGRSEPNDWYDSMTCGDCKRGFDEVMDFLVADPIWNFVMGGEARTTYTIREGLFDERLMARSEGVGGVVCLACFDKRARALGIEYRESVLVFGVECWMGGHYNDGVPLVTRSEGVTDARATLKDSGGGR